MIHYHDIQFEDIQLIKEVWECNRTYHKNITQHFPDLYDAMIFEERMNNFADVLAENLKITLAEDLFTGKLLGYCISTVFSGEGEIHSLHVLEEARRQGIGKALMQSHLQWLNQNGCVLPEITVDCGNKDAIKFYEWLGFKPATVDMILRLNR
ncbi:MAG: GNAT family N-acetyltransferase [Erysipelotrichaceae bacterium]|nr:GNAT family N-acetyltransferase [Erysipelotrichaceae bacterium]